MIARLAAVIFLLVIGGLGPGMLLIRRCRLAPLERLCAALGLSWIVIYLYATLIYLTGMSWNWAYAGSAICAILCAIGWRDIRDLFKSHLVRRTLGSFGLLFIWMMLLLGLVRTYSGGTWSGDWAEHYDRARFFLERWPKDSIFIHLYTLPARPPMMNEVAAYFMAQVGTKFPGYELMMALLSLSAFLSAALLLNLLNRRGRRGLGFLLLALCSSPFFAQNVTYVMTKLFCAMFVALGIALYVRGHRKGDHTRRILAFVMMAAGVLVHYSAGPFTVFLALHYLWTFLRKWRQRWRELLAIIASGAALLASWFSWCIVDYGLHGAVSATTTVSASQKLSATGNLLKVIWNIYYSLVPYSFRRLNVIPHRQLTAGFLRDIAFYCYQENFFFMMGSAGAVVAIWVFLRTIFPRTQRIHPPAKQRWFWIILVLFCIPAAIATHGSLQPPGVAHVVLQPLVLIGIAAIAACAGLLPRWGKALLMIGWMVDFFLGVWLQFYLENLTFTPVNGPNGQVQWYMPQRLAEIVQYNFAEARTRNILFIGDHWANFATIFQITLIGGELLLLWWIWRRELGRPKYARTAPAHHPCD